MEFKYQDNIKYLIIALVGVILITIAYLIYLIDPLQLIMDSFLTLSEGSFLYEIWTNPPHEVLVKSFIFNVTNHEAFLNGTEKLKFQEVGPYVYQEILNNSAGRFNEDDTLTFEPKRQLIFRRDLSVGDIEEDIILSPNIPLLGITSALYDYNMFMNLAVASISSYLNSKPFVNITVKQYLWGYDDKLVTLAANVVPMWIDFPKFGILDRLMALDNANNTVTINLKSSKIIENDGALEDIETVLPYSIHEFNGSPGLKHWGYVKTNETEESNTRCNTIAGTYDGGLFPRNLPENVTLRLYRRAFCRPVDLKYQSTTYNDDGYKIYNYRVYNKFLATAEENPDNKCYCKSKKCLPSGFGSLAPCYYSLPVIISQPHYLNADPKIIKQVEGLKPEEEKHDTFVQINPDIGMPVTANLRIQINLDVNTKYNSKTKVFNSLMLPLLWLELCIERIPPQLKFYVTAALVVMPIIQKVFMWLSCIIGVSMIAASALIIFYFPPQHRLEDPYGNRIGYSPILVIPIPQTFKPDIRISK